MTPWFLTLPLFHDLDFSVPEAYHAVRFEKNTRYYTIRLEKDLFEEWVIVVINGQIQSRLGQSRTLAFSCFNEALDRFYEMINVRQKRHYHLSTYRSDDFMQLHLLPYLMSSKPSKININQWMRDKPGHRILIKDDLSITQTNSFIPSTYQQMGFNF